MLSPLYFYRATPKDKRKKDSLISRFLFRPISYLFASFFSFLHISANKVSVLSIFVAIASGILFLFDNQICRIVGASLVIFWCVLDCTDGDLARAYGPKANGELYDGVAGYVLIAWLYPCVGVSLFFTGGLFFQANFPWSILLGAGASVFDLSFRLIFKKYGELSYDLKTSKKTSKEMEKEWTTKATFLGRTLHLIRRLNLFFGIDGLLSIWLLISTIFSWVDLFIIPYFCINAILWVGTITFCLYSSRKIHLE